MIRSDYTEGFWLRVEKTEGCWNWLGHKDRDGYGLWHTGWPSYKQEMCHRISYRLERGAVPDGLTLDHICFNTSCVNPAHLEPVTLRENILRGRGVCAINARKTHCLRGHEFTEKNTHVNPRGSRVCRKCRNEWSNRRYHQRRNSDRQVTGISS